MTRRSDLTLRRVRGTGDRRVEATWRFDDSWELRATFLAESGSPIIERLTLEPSPRRRPPAGGITARLLRDIRFNELFQPLEEEGIAGQLGREVLGTHDIPDDTTTIRHPGRRGREDREYAIWAARYIDKLSRGHRNPHPELAREHNVSDRTIQDLIQEARAREILSSPGQGRAGGHLTRYGESLLEEGGYE